MKKTVGIITIHSAYNYGAFLQAKATELAIEKLGYNAKFIDYTNKEEEKQRKLFTFSKRYSLKKNIRQFIRAIYVGIIKKEFFNGKRNFQNEIDNLPKTKKYNSKNEIMNDIKFDILLSGSDQIWNPQIYNGQLDQVYFLDISETIPKVSYASSIGSYTINEEDGEKIGYMLNKFCSINVRESFAKNQLQSFVNKEINVVIDPTLLINSDEWMSKCENSKTKFSLEEKNYILVYMVTGYAGKEKYIEVIKEKYKKKVVLITLDCRNRKYVDIVLNNVNPYDFIYLIKNSFMVVTDSFHGTAFSINMNTNFINIENKKNPYRVRELLSSLDLLEYSVREPNEILNISNHIDFTKANQLLNILRKNSTEILMDSLKKGETNA